MDGFAKSEPALCKQNFLRRSWLLPSDQEIPGSRQKLESNV